jgi:hypothetical protein
MKSMKFLNLDLVRSLSYSQGGYIKTKQYTENSVTSDWKKFALLLTRSNLGLSVVLVSDFHEEYAAKVFSIANSKIIISARGYTLDCRLGPLADLVKARCDNPDKLRISLRVIGQYSSNCSYYFETVSITEDLSYMILKDKNGVHAYFHH